GTLATELGYRCRTLLKGVWQAGGSGVDRSQAMKNEVNRDSERCPSGYEHVANHQYTSTCETVLGSLSIIYFTGCWLFEIINCCFSVVAQIVLPNHFRITGWVFRSDHSRCIDSGFPA